MSAVVLRAALPGARLEFTIEVPDRPELTTWTAGFWAQFPDAGNEVPDQRYSLRRDQAAIVLQTPAGCTVLDERTAPPAWDSLMRSLLRWHGGSALLHAGLVHGPAGALLLAGVSGTGKSTMVRTLLRRGYDYGGDEYVHVSTAGLLALPRPIDDDGLAPAPAEWIEIAGPDGRPCRSGHWPERLRRARLPWPRLLGSVVLERRRGPVLRVRRLSRVPVGLWLNRPRWTDAPAVWQLHRRPLCSLEPAGIEETAAQLARWLDGSEHPERVAPTA